MSKVVAIPTREQIPVPLLDAIEWQQRRVWYLRCLLQCVSVAGQHGCDTEITDLEGTLNGLADYADSIHLALDPDALVKAASRSRSSESHDDKGAGPS